MEKKVDEVPREEKANIVEELLFEEKLDSRPRNALCPTFLENKTPLPIAALDSLETKNAEMKKKLRFSISLSPKEIEEDILLMTGSKLSKKPKKRGEAVQTDLDKLFLGMRFASGDHSGLLYQWQVHLQEKKKREENAVVDQSVNATES